MGRAQACNRGLTVGSRGRVSRQEMLSAFLSFDEEWSSD